MFFFNLSQKEPKINFFYHLHHNFSLCHFLTIPFWEILCHNLKANPPSTVWELSSYIFRLTLDSARTSCDALLIARCDALVVICLQSKLTSRPSSTNELQNDVICSNLQWRNKTSSSILFYFIFIQSLLAGKHTGLW